MPKRSTRTVVNADERNKRVASGTTLRSLDWKCPYCKNWYSAQWRGPEKHLISCHVRLSQKKRERVSSAVLEGIPDFPRTPAAPQEDLHAQQDNRITPDRFPPLDDTTDDGFDDVGRCKDLLSPGISPSRPSRTAYMHEDEHMEPSDGDMDLQDVFDPYTFPLQRGETLVVPHAHAGIAPYTIPTTSSSSSSGTHPTAGVRQQFPPWHPFPSLVDFEQTEHFVERNTPDPAVNKQLEISRKGANSSKMTIQNARDMHMVLEEAIEFDDLGEFQKEYLDVPYRNEIRRYTLRLREAMPAMIRVLEDESLLPVIKLYPEKRYVLRSDGQSNMRVISEAYTADDWHEIQTAVGPGKVVIYYCVYADATQLNAFGTHKAWPIYVWVSNVPKALRRGKTKGRAILLGFLPHVSGKNHDDASHLATHRVAVYHAAMRRIFQSLEFSAELGEPFDTLLGGEISVEIGVPVCAVASMDLEERYRQLCLLGTKSGFPCTVCLVPHDKQSLFRLDWPLRTQECAQALLKTAKKISSAEGKKATLASQSLRNIDNAFFPLCGRYFDVFRTSSGDPLHAIEQGAHGKHNWVWLLEHCLDKDMKDYLDQLFMNIPPFPGVHHFPNGVTSLKYITAREHNTILRYLGPLLTGLKPEVEHLTLPLFRHLACALLLARFDTHTEDTLALLEEQLNLFGAASERIEAADLGLTFNYPKFHSILKHLVDQIREKGTVDNYATDLGEALHPQTKVDWRRTNHQQTAEDQMLRMAQERDVVASIRRKIDAAEDEAAFEPTSKNTSNIPAHIALGSPQRVMHVESYPRLLKDQGIVIPNFQTRLLDFLRRTLDAHEVPADISYYKVKPFRTVRISYICQMSAQHNQDIMHIAPNWRNNGPRYDRAMLQGASVNKPMFAETAAVFSINIAGSNCELGIVQFFQQFSRHKLSQYIELEKLDTYEFVFIDSFLRAAHIVSPTLYYPRYVVQDLLNGDMYLRLLKTK